MPTLQKAADAAEISADKPTAAPVTNFFSAVRIPQRMERGHDLRKPPALSQVVFFDTLLRHPSAGGTGNSGAEAFPLIPSGDKVPLSCHGAGCKTRSETHRKQTSQSPVPSKGGDGVLQALTSPSDLRRQCGQACSDTSWRSSLRTCWPACLPVRRRRPCLPRGRGRQAFRPAHWGSSWDNRR